ncbi:hypothetical protein GCM10022234_06670 [Aeromicrobium panaciterrae]|uniref:Ig-like domain-containing protein n=1 Tax=Aeromicrobium panaciterrae TaxID=363861 RepID=UPI0031CFBFDC
MITPLRAVCAVLAMLFVLPAPAMADEPPPGTPGFVAGDDSFQVDKGSTLIAFSAVHGVLDNDSLGASPCLLAACGVAVEDYPTHGTLSTSGFGFGGFMYVPDPAFSGTDSFTYRATSAPTAYSNRATVTIAVTESPATPGFVANDDTYNIPQDTSARLNGFVDGPMANDTVNGTPCEARLCAFVLKNPPSHGSFIQGYGETVYRPAPGFVGTDTFTYRIADPASPARSNAATITINVHGAPSATPDSYTTTEGVQLSVNAAGGVLHNDLNATGLNLGTGVSHGVLDLNTITGAFTYDPAPGFVGSDSFTYSAKNSDGVSEPVTVAITVKPTPPVANGDAYGTAERVQLSVDASSGVLSNDTAANSAALVTSTSHGILSLEDDGAFDYMPAEDFSGTDSFTYTATGPGGTTAPATVTIAVSDVGDDPFANGDSYELDKDGSLTVEAPGVLGNDVGATGARLVTDVEHGRLDFGGDGAFSYVPDEGYDGVDGFTYIATYEPPRNHFLKGEAGLVAAAAFESEPATVRLMVSAAADPGDRPDGDGPGGEAALPDTGSLVNLANLSWAALATLAGIVLVVGASRRRA